ncbi:MAG: ribosome silencing factor [Thermoleophilia bacterium]
MTDDTNRTEDEVRPEKAQTAAEALADDAAHPDTDATSAVAADSAEATLGVPVRTQPRERSSDDKLELIHRHALLAAATASGMKAEDIRILDVHDMVSYTDFLVICTGRSARQTGRIAEEIALKLKKELGLIASSVEGERPGEWVLLDYLDFIVHVFTPEAHDFYRLDVLWKQAPTEIIE